MFEYAKMQLNEEIIKLEEKYDLKKNEEKNIVMNKNHIDSYLELRDKKNNSIFMPFPSILIIVLGLITSLSQPAPIVAKVVTGIVLLTSGCCVIAVSWSELLKIKKEIKKSYGDISSLSDKELDDELSLLSQKEAKAYNDAKDIFCKIDCCKTELKKINCYEKLMKEFNKPYYMADSKEEYQQMSLSQSEYLQIFDDYLNENIDYSNIHFDNRIQNEETSKKLVKKDRSHL